jgi:hypothetical protein
VDEQEENWTLISEDERPGSLLDEDWILDPEA